MKLVLDAQVEIKKEEKKKIFTLKKNSCMHEVLSIIKEQTGASGNWLESNPDLAAAAMDVVWALWHESTTEIVRSRPAFWDNVTQAVFFSKGHFTSRPTDDETRSFYFQSAAQARVFDILAIEAFYTGGSINAALKTRMEEFATKIKFSSNEWLAYGQLYNHAHADAVSNVLTSWARVVCVASTNKPNLHGPSFAPCFGLQGRDLEVIIASIIQVNTHCKIYDYLINFLFSLLKQRRI